MNDALSLQDGKGKLRHGGPRARERELRAPGWTWGQTTALGGGGMT